MNTEYRCVTDIREVREYIGGNTLVSYDYETAPDQAYRNEDRAALDPAKSHICTMSLSVKEQTAIMIPVAHKAGTNMPADVFDAFLREFLTDTTVTKVCHNYAFESAFSYARGIVIQAPVFDTICAAQMTLKSPTEFRKLSDSGLKTLALNLCHEPLPSFEAVTKGQHFDELDPTDPETIRYSCADADFALRLYRITTQWFDKYLPRHRWIVENIESPTAVYLGIMKANGVPVDSELMTARQEEADREMDRIRTEIAGIIGDVNIGSNCSTNEFKSYLYGTLGLPVLKTTETNREAADDATMIMLREWCDRNKPELSHLFELVQEYRKWNKISSTYIAGYRKYINSATGRIHPNFYALSTDTGRFSCNQPNLQNMPRKGTDPIGVRNFIKAPAGHLIVSCDYSQIELRVGSQYCRDATMMETYKTGGDIHAATTSVLFSIPYEKALDKHDPDFKERRTIAKNCNFGVFYGLFARGLQRTLKFKAGLDKSVGDCEEIIANLKAGYPGLAVWQEEVKKDAHWRKYAETAFGRRRYLPGIDSDDWGKRSFAERCAMNTPIQGTAADIIKLAMGRILKGLPDRPWLKPILQIHDELTFIVPEEKLAEAVGYIRSCMEPQPYPEFDLPLVAEASAGPSFGNMEELE